MVKMPNTPPEKIQTPGPYIKKIAEQSLDTALLLVYADVKKNGAADTIIAIIPIAYKMGTPQPIKDTLQAAPITASLPGNTNSVKKEWTAGQPVTPSNKVTNTSCKAFATDYDVDKLRVKLMAADNLDDKIVDAKKVFRLNVLQPNKLQHSVRHLQMMKADIPYWKRSIPLFLIMKIFHNSLVCLPRNIISTVSRRCLSNRID